MGNIMRKYGNRKIKVKKSELLAKIEENKALHIQDYEAAVIAYKDKAISQLNNLLKNAKNGSLKIELQLVHPINKAGEYDKIITMFNMDVEETIELDQDEFNAYVFDELDFSSHAKLSNSAYRS